MKCNGCEMGGAGFVPPYRGKGNLRLVCVGEAPGAQEVEQGRPFVGQSGQLLQAILSDAGLDPESEVYYTNVVKCRPPQNRTPSEEEIAACLPALQEELKEFGNIPIMALGKVAGQALLGYDAPRGTFVGNVVHTWHPAYCLRKPSSVPDLQRDIRYALAGPKKKVIKIPPHRIYRDYKELAAVLPDTNAQVVLDIETDDVHWYNSRANGISPLLMIGLKFAEQAESIIISQELMYDDYRTVLLLRKRFKKYRIIMHNVLFDACYLKNVFDIDCNILDDTMVMHYTLNELTGTHGLKLLASNYLLIEDYEKEFVSKYMTSKNDDYSKVPEDELARYCALDVVSTERLYKLFYKLMTADALWDMPYRDILLPALRALFQAKLSGIQVDLERLLEAKSEFEKETVELVVRMREMSGLEDYNPNSWQQTGAIIWDDYGLTINTRTKVYNKTPRSTCDEALEHLKGHPFVDILLHYRRVQKMISSYIDNILENMDVNGRIHPDFKLHGTEVGRLSASDPAAQTIPRPSDKYGAAIRSSIIAAPGNVLVDADFSQAELRVFAALSQDPFLIKVFQDGRDLHSEVARAMFGDDFTKEQRVMCKMFNFSYIYGGSEYSFARDAGLELRVATQFVREYNKNMPVAVQWKRDQLKEMREVGYVMTRTGRRRRIPILTDSNINEARKSAVHAPVAGLASDITLMAFTQLRREGYNAILTVHDSIILEAPKKEAKKVAERARELMVGTASHWVPEVPWKVDVEIKDRWYDEDKKTDSD